MKKEMEDKKKNQTELLFQIEKYSLFNENTLDGIKRR